MQTRPSTRRVLTLSALLFAGSVQAVDYSTPVRNVENPDRFPYQESAYFTIDTPYVNNFAYFATPSGKRYIVEFVSISCVTPSASDSFPQIYLNLSKTVSGGTIGYGIPLQGLTRTGTSPFGGYIYSGAMTVKAYGDPSPYDAGGGNAIYLNVFHADTTVRPSCSAAVTGHTVSNP